MFTIYYVYHKTLFLRLYFLTYDDVLFFKRGLLHHHSREFYCTTVYTDDHEIYSKALVSHAKILEKILAQHNQCRSNADPTQSTYQRN